MFYLMLLLLFNFIGPTFQSSFSKSVLGSWKSSKWKNENAKMEHLTKRGRIETPLGNSSVFIRFRVLHYEDGDG